LREYFLSQVGASTDRSTSTKGHYTLTEHILDIQDLLS
jgi:hypothetical protein